MFIQRSLFAGLLAAAAGLRVVVPAHADDMQHQPLSHLNGRFFIEADDRIVEIPNITTFCLGCHDGTVGPARQSPFNEDLNQTVRCRGMPGGHPVGVVYPIGTAHDEFADPLSLPDRMLLVEGWMTCVSCHDVEAENHDLVIDNRRSALCLTCHRK